MQPKFNNYVSDTVLILKCPFCGFDCTHHTKVEVFDRKNDAEVGLHVTVIRGSIETDMDISNNPSCRRQGLLIHFWCEGCGERPILGLAQHKGQTYVGFLSVGEKAF